MFFTVHDTLSQCLIYHVVYSFSDPISCPLKTAMTYIIVGHVIFYAAATFFNFCNNCSYFCCNLSFTLLLCLYFSSSLKFTILFSCVFAWFACFKYLFFIILFNS